MQILFPHVMLTPQVSVTRQMSVQRDSTPGLRQMSNHTIIQRCYAKIRSQGRPCISRIDTSALQH